MIYILIAIAVIVLYLVGFYNSLVTIKQRIAASIQEIGNQLKRQAQLIPNLVESVKGYLSHEKGIFDSLTEARKLIDSGDSKSVDKAQDLITKTLGSLRVIVESNPQLASAPLVTNLMDELRDTADKLMYSRRTLIDLTVDYNTKISTIPGLWFASLLGFKPEKGLEVGNLSEATSVSAEETKTPQVKLN